MWRKLTQSLWPVQLCRRDRLPAITDLHQMLALVPDSADLRNQPAAPKVGVRPTRYVRFLGHRRDPGGSTTMFAERSRLGSHHHS